MATTPTINQLAPTEEFIFLLKFFSGIIVLFAIGIIISKLLKIEKYKK